VFAGKGCGVVRFYSRQAARAALVLDGYPLCGSAAIRVETSQSREQQQLTKRPPGNQALSVQKAIELCNHYVGFSAWSSRVTALQSLPCAEPAAEGEKIKCAMSATVIMQFPSHGGTTVAGRGIGRYAAKTRADAIEKARKFAVSAARRNGFSKIAIVLLSNPSKVIVARLGVDDDAVETREGEDEAGDDDDGGGGGNGIDGVPL
jgi:hypothetical protein